MIKNFLYIVCALCLIIGIESVEVFGQAQYTINGQNPFTLMLETGSCQTVSIALDPSGEITSSPPWGGVWIEYDSTQVSVNSISVYEDPPGWWEPGVTVISPVPPNAYLVQVQTALAVPIIPIDAPILIADVEFCCTAVGQSTVFIKTIPEFDTWISITGPSSWVVWDPYIDQGIINLAQVIPQTDSDDDGILDYEDNCLFEHNTNQVDTYPPGGNGIGDACDCESDLDCDGDVDGTDKANFKLYFGRSLFENPCNNEPQCSGDFDCDNDCDGTDVSKFKEDFGRSGYGNPCPPCTPGAWCIYP